MVKQAHHRNPVRVKLENDIAVNTTIPHEQHAALRAGFVGYPVNPRWNVDKYCAWKIGCQLRNSFQQGELIVRQSDSCLIPTITSKTKFPANHKRLDALMRPISAWTQNILAVLPFPSS